MIGTAQDIPADSLRAVIRRVYEAPEYDWGRSRNLLAEAWAWFRRQLEQLNGLADTHPVAYWIIILLLTTLLVAIVVHLGWTLWQVLRPRAPAVARSGLATPVRRDARWYLTRARQLAAEGRYAEAVAHRFRALVLELDRRGAVSFHPSKTPAEYVREAKLGARERERLAAVVGTLYRCLFGGSPCTRDDVTRLESDAEEVYGAGAAV